MIFPGLKKLAAHYGFQSNGTQCFGIIKNVFVSFWDGYNRKILRVLLPAVDDDDAAFLQSWQKKKYAKECDLDREKNEVHYIFTEYVFPYSIARMQEIIDSVVAHFAQKYPDKDVPCYHCGNTADIQIVSFESIAGPLCGACRSKLNTDIEEANNNFATQETRYAAGTAGAILFSLPCVLLTLLLFFLGKLSALSGILHYYAAVKGYQVFKGKFDKIGFFITVIVGAVLSAFGTAFSYVAYVTFKFKQANPEYPISAIFLGVIEMIKTDAEVFGEFKTNILVALVCCGIGILLTAFQNFKSTKAVQTDKIK